jgi:hypothetical protein
MSLFQYQAEAANTNRDAGAVDPGLFEFFLPPTQHPVHKQANRAQGSAQVWVNFTPELPANPHRGRVKSMVNRDPQVDPRTGKALDKIHEIINGLMGRGELVQVHDKGWRINAFPVIVSIAAPTVDDDEIAKRAVGQLWIVPGGPSVYICVDNSEGAAVWVQLT